MFKSVVTLALLAASATHAAPLVSSTDIIPNGSRTALVDFEPLPNADNLGPVFSQGGVTVTQVNGETNDIWTGCASLCFYTNTSRTWYANGGDFGWTQIRRDDGSDFDLVGLDIGSVVFGYRFLQYELRNNGSAVLSGQLANPGGSDAYLGFSGGGFDTIWLRAGSAAFAGTFGSGEFQALSIDNIELGSSNKVPEPAGLALGGLALLALTGARRRAR